MYDQEDAKIYYSNRNSHKNLANRQAVSPADKESFSFAAMDQIKNEAHKSFMKNNVRTEMAYMTSQVLWGSPITESGTTERKETQSPRTLSPNMMMTTA